MNDLKIKLTLEQIKTYFNLAIFIIIIASIAYASIFLYKNFYLVITQSEEIMVLQQRVDTNTINEENFDKIIKNLGKKDALEENAPKIKNPF